jgi:hypothetical protein
MIRAIGFIELAIGVVTVLFATLFNALSLADKPLGTLIFVIISGAISGSIGYGILKKMDWARVMLLFFSGYVIILKALIYFGVVSFTGEIITAVPSYLKDAVSVVYHLAVIMIFIKGGSKWRKAER